jgi:hypothetical protein
MFGKYSFSVLQGCLDDERMGNQQSIEKLLSCLCGIRSKNLGFFDKADRDWDEAWKMKLTPWDLKGKINPTFMQVLDSEYIRDVDGNETMKALLPGCCSGYELLYLKKWNLQRLLDWIFTNCN